jgi:hypothetical protein
VQFPPFWQGSRRQRSRGFWQRVPFQAGPHEQVKFWADVPMQVPWEQGLSQQVSMYWNGTVAPSLPLDLEMDEAAVPER